MEGRERVVALAVDKDKSSINALKWAITHIVTRNETLRLLHVKDRSPSGQAAWGIDQEQIDAQISEMLLSMKCYCQRKQVNCETLILEDNDVAKAIVDYINQYGVKILIMGTPNKIGISRLFKNTDIPSTVMKWAPDYCTVYVIAKRKISSVRNSCRSAPVTLPPLSSLSANAIMSSSYHHNVTPSIKRVNGRSYDNFDYESILAGISDGRLSLETNNTFYDTVQDTNSSSSTRPSRATTTTTRTDHVSNWETPRPSSYVDCPENFDSSSHNDNTNISTDNHSSWDSSDYERQLRRLKTELKHTMEMYHAACKEAIAAKRKVVEVEKWKEREEKRIEEARGLEDKVSLIVEKEKEKIFKEATEAAQRCVEDQVEKRIREEIDSIRGFEQEDIEDGLDSLGQSLTVIRYKSLYHMVAVVFLFYFYFSISYLLTKDS
ncbi:U-box domain-containing protein 35 [Linum perenne]